MKVRPASFYRIGALRLRFHFIECGADKILRGTISDGVPSPARLSAGWR